MAGSREDDELGARDGGGQAAAVLGVRLAGHGTEPHDLRRVR